MNALEHFDHWLFLLVNGWHSPFFDQIMYHISARLTWVPFYVVLLYGVIKKAGKHWWVAILAIALLILLADQLSVHCFKNVFLRYRPCHNLNLLGQVHLVNEHCGGQYGFVSSHASNFFAIATFFSLFFKYRWITLGLYTAALLTIYSRVYLGVHYPTDVAVGAALGALVGFGVYHLYMVVLKRYFKIG
jgi:undecaprenyl-diphosphatase